eukprot:3107573-Pyramimonas_sp.AAC.1
MASMVKYERVGARQYMQQFMAPAKGAVASEANNKVGYPLCDLKPIDIRERATFTVVEAETIGEAYKRF